MNICAAGKRQIREADPWREGRHDAIGEGAA